MAKIAILGHGVVGSGVAEVLLKNAESIALKAGEPIEIGHILDIREFPGLPYSDRFTTNFDDIINDDDVSVVVEVIGGLTPSYGYVRASLEAGKSVVTSNKELVAQKGAGLLQLAKDRGVDFLFEASVGGGIPIISPLHQCLAANRLHEITGILNGTTNFILTKMVREGMSFDQALRTAQRLGYAERNPAADIEGHDTCRKICILASLAFGRHVYPQWVRTEGITALTLEDIECARRLDGVIKLLGSAREMDDGQLYITVSPCFIPREHPLANVEDVFNGILVKGDAIGDVVFYGRGAGKLPTASAVVADIINCVRHTHAHSRIYWRDALDGEQVVAEPGRVETAKLIRLACDDKQKASVKASAVFGKVREAFSENGSEYAFLSPKMPESALDEAVRSLVESGAAKKVISSIRAVI